MFRTMRIVVAAAGVLGGGSASVPHSAVGRQRGKGASSSDGPASAQLHVDARIGGSHAPVSLLPAPRERSSCQPRPYEMVFRTRTGTSML